MGEAGSNRAVQDIYSFPPDGLLPPLLFSSHEGKYWSSMHVPTGAAVTNVNPRRYLPPWKVYVRSRRSSQQKPSATDTTSLGG